MQSTPLALTFARARAGRSKPARIAMMAITTSNSISVNPLIRFISLQLSSLWYSTWSTWYATPWHFRIYVSSSHWLFIPCLYIWPCELAVNRAGGLIADSSDCVYTSTRAGGHAIPEGVTDLGFSGEVADSPFFHRSPHFLYTINPFQLIVTTFLMKLLLSRRFWL
jgi:hypothetical protein